MGNSDYEILVTHAEVLESCIRYYVQTINREIRMLRGYKDILEHCKNELQTTKQKITEYEERDRKVLKIS